MKGDYELQMIQEMADSARRELAENILPYWIRYGKDEQTGGFYGLIDGENRGDGGHPKGLVAHGRFLWTYAAAARTVSGEFLKTAEYAAEYLRRWFWDGENGGFFWSVTGDGSAPVINKKQIYGQAFALYGFSELLRIPGYGDGELARQMCRDIFSLLEAHGRDAEFGGYREACEADWSPARDRRLSASDMDCEKSMNTNLHVLEAYTNYYRVAADPAVGEALGSLIRIIGTEIVRGDHQGLFFDRDWQRLDRAVSYGHDIETSWLLIEAAEVLGDAELVEFASKVGLRMAAAVYRQGLDHTGWWLANELHDPDRPESRDNTRIWWVQAEGSVGFLNAYQKSGNLDYLRAASGMWRFCLDHQRAANGEWYWGLDENNRPDTTREKGGLWKTPYHNGRACMEIIERAEHLTGGR